VPRRVRVERVLDAPPQRVWEVLEPIERHVDWMLDAEAIVFDGEQTRGAGTRMWCKTKVGPFRLVDQMEVTEWEPQRAMGVRHTGIVSGEGRFELQPVVGNRTRFSWTEELQFPWYVGGPVTGLAGAVILTAVWRRNLANLARLVEVESSAP
jgi:uncharacterized protein YndB with AHSA1/START domain